VCQNASNVLEYLILSLKIEIFPELFSKSTQKMTESCAFCGDFDSEKLKKCSGCGNVAYCSIKCQRQHWPAHKNHCKAWKVTTDPENPKRGRFVVATRKIIGGEIIFREEPILLGPRLDPNVLPMCSGCFGKLKKINYKCPKCGVEICSEKCAQNQFHLLECDLLASAKLEKWEFPELRTPLRFLGMKEKDPKKYAQLRSLVSNTNVKKNGPDWERISKMSTDILEKFQPKDFALKEIEDIICALESNSYQVMSTNQSLNGVYMQASMLNHTCYKANTRPSFGQDFLMKVVATDDIAMGQEIFTSYLEPFHTNLQRRAILLRGKSFECSCARCMDPLEFGTKASCYKCQVNCAGTGKGLISAHSSQHFMSEWSCDTCQVTIPGKESMEFDNSLSKEGRKVNRSSLEHIEKFINVYSKLLSQNHVFLLQLKVWMLEGLNRLPYANPNKEDLYVKKIKLCQEVLSGMDKFESSYSYLNGILHIELADTLVQKLSQMFSGGMKNMLKNMDPMQFINQAKQSLKVAEIVFKNESPKSQDHQLLMKVGELKMAIANFG